MRKVWVIIGLSIIIPVSAFGDKEINEWDYARPQITEESILELREYPQFKYLPSSHIRLFAACIVEKRIQMGKKIGCTWEMKPGITAQEHIAKQYRCFEDGGYGKSERTEHGEFCGILIREYFRALDKNSH